MSCNGVYIGGVFHANIACRKIAALCFKEPHNPGFKWLVKSYFDIIDQTPTGLAYISRSVLLPGVNGHVFIAVWGDSFIFNTQLVWKHRFWYLNRRPVPEPMQKDALHNSTFSVTALCSVQWPKALLSVHQGSMQKDDRLFPALWKQPGIWIFQHNQKLSIDRINKTWKCLIPQTFCWCSWS